MSFLGGGSPYMGSNSYGGGMYGNSYGSSMYNSGYGGMGSMMNPQLQQNQQLQNGENPQQNPEYQFDLRRDLQATIGGLNCSLGLAYCMTQMINLSQLGVKYFYKGLKFILSKIFDRNNIIAPLQFIMRLLFGIRFKKDNQSETLDLMEQAWKNSHPDNEKNFWPKKILGMSPAIFKSLILALTGIILQVVLYFLKKNKSQNLKKIEEEEQEKNKLLEEMWFKERNKQLEQQSPDLTLIKDIDQNEFEEIKAYNGELTGMTFNHIKENKAFDPFRYNFTFDNDENDLSWLETTTNSNINKNENISSNSHFLKKSEDGWNRKKV